MVLVVGVQRILDVAVRQHCAHYPLMLGLVVLTMVAASDEDVWVASL